MAGLGDATALLSVVGRTLLVLAGAFLLRALTESGTFEPGTGAALGMVYALASLVAADRSARSHRTWSAIFHGMTAAVIALPLLVEATVRLRLLTPVTSAMALGTFAVLALGVSARRRLQGLAWIASLGTVLAALVLAVVTHTLAPPAVVLVLLTTATLWFGYVLDWFALRWPVAFATDLLVLVLGGRAASAAGVADTPAGALVAQILLLATSLGSVAARTLLLRRDVVPVEVVQTVGALVAGLGGAAWVTRARGTGGSVLGVAALVLGAGCYAVAIAFSERRMGWRRNFSFYTSAALALLMAGTGILLPPAALAVAWSLLALGAFLASRRTGRRTFHWHGTLFAFGAALVSGLVLLGGRALGLPVTLAEGPPVVRLVVLAACILGVFLLGPTARWRPNRFSERLPRLVMLALAVTGSTGVVAHALAPALERTVGGATTGASATLGTMLLVAATLGLAWAGGTRGIVEAAWLVYPLLAVTGLKLAIHDLATGRPATLFVAFAFYGVALLVAPRWRRRTRRNRGAEGSPDAGGG